MEEPGEKVSLRKCVGYIFIGTTRALKLRVCVSGEKAEKTAKWVLMLWERVRAKERREGAKVHASIRNGKCVCVRA